MDEFKALIGKVATGAALTREEAASAFDVMKMPLAGRCCLPARNYNYAAKRSRESFFAGR